MKYIEGGVCAPLGYKAAGISCGIKNNSKKDLALIISEKRAAVAGVYTKNLVKGAPITVTQRHISDGYAQAIICNSGNANTCNSNGIEVAEGMCGLVEEKLGIPSNDVAVASTGVIGQRMSLTPISSSMEYLISSLGDNSDDAAQAIMTTDTKKKEVAVEFMIDGKAVKIGGIAKGSGMIHPDMATMLVFITTDVAISPSMLQEALNFCIQDSFNMISVDRDTSTNDTVLVLANGLAGNSTISSEGPEYAAFKAALFELSVNLSCCIAGDGEGATKLLICTVSGAKDNTSARVAAKSVITSSLLKCAMFGADANWGRVLSAMGNSGADIDIEKIAVTFSSKAGSVSVCKSGHGIEFPEELAKTILCEDEILIDINLDDGNAKASAYGCDLTYEYVKINGDYRS